MLFRKKPWPVFTFEEIKKRSRILVIDDAEFFYTQLFAKDGYTVEKWDDVKDLPKLESNYFDIILLDIQGVGRQYTSEQGLGILKHLKRNNPAQLIIAYSNSDYSLKYQEFFEMADAKLAKEQDYINFKTTVDELLKQRFSVDFYLDKITTIVTPHTADPHKIVSMAKKGISNSKEGRINKALCFLLDNKEAVRLVLTVVQTALTVKSTIVGI